MAPKVTSLDVAREAGVSQSAVSRVFTPGASASAKTAEKVRAAAEALGYRPNAMARAMITGRSRIIGLVVAYLDNQFYPMALEHLSNALQAEGYHILVFTVSNDPARVDAVIAELLDYQVDGIITASVSLSGDIARRCVDTGIPVVAFNRRVEADRVAAVTSANFAGGAKVAQYLLGKGYRRLGHISGWLGASTGVDRQHGFVDALAKARVSPVAIADGMFSRETATGVAADMLATARPEAIFVGNDHMALAVLDHLRFEMGLSVPGDVAVVGYDDVPLAAWPAYNLTTVRQPVTRMVAATVDLLLESLRGAAPGPMRHIEIDGDLIERGTT